MSEFIDSRFKELAELWFLTEPAYFALFCTHELRANPKMACPIRTGQGRIEYNPELLAGITHKAAFEELVGIEMLRLFLKHPYERTPDKTHRGAMKAASDAVLTSHYRFSYHQLTQPKDLGLPGGKHYEWYLANIPQPQQGTPGQNMSGNDGNPESGGGEAGGDGDSEDKDESQKGEENENGEGAENGCPDSEEPSGNEDSDAVDEGGDKRNSDDGLLSSGQDSMGSEQYSSDMCQTPPPTKAEQDAAVAGLWEEDDARQLEINDLIIHMRGWGGLAGTMEQIIIANTRARIDYRKVLSGFRASVISMDRSLTRMKPNRRTGFEHMGSRHDFGTALLIAVDVSGSITDKVLQNFYSVIVKFFKYGIQSIDVIQFDTEIKGEPETLNKARTQKTFNIRGRGGNVSFQLLFDYVEKHRQYDGLIILTDGEAPHPKRKIRGGVRVLWICESEEFYKRHRSWMSQYGRVCYMNLI